MLPWVAPSLNIQTIPSHCCYHSLLTTQFEKYGTNLSIDYWALKSGNHVCEINCLHSLIYSTDILLSTANAKSTHILMLLSQGRTLPSVTWD